jgi:hypothetical protein
VAARSVWTHTDAVVSPTWRSTGPSTRDTSPTLVSGAPPLPRAISGGSGQAWSSASSAAPIFPAAPPNVAGTTGGIPRAVGA